MLPISGTGWLMACSGYTLHRLSSMIDPHLEVNMRVSKVHIEDKSFWGKRVILHGSFPNSMHVKT